MLKLRPANERGHTLIGWLDSYHTFSFGDYYDPKHMGFSDLRVINDDVVAPDMGFGTHPHANMEIISIVLSGELEHKDSMGNGSVIKVGEVQKMSAGTGVYHSEFNPSSKEPVHFLQIWIMPNVQNIKPSYEQKSFKKEDMTNELCYIATPDGRHGSFILQQDAELFQCLLDENKTVVYKADPKRKYWIHVATGSLKLNGQVMVAGDGMGIEDENTELEFTGIDKQSNFLLFNLPL